MPKTSFSEESILETTVPKSGTYRPEIDGLRAFAVTAVIINHFNSSILPGGYLGVDIFFVISGYVITSSLAYRSYKDFRLYLGHERRIKRLSCAISFCPHHKFNYLPPAAF